MRASPRMLISMTGRRSHVLRISRPVELLPQAFKRKLRNSSHIDIARFPATTAHVDHCRQAPQKQFSFLNW
jgi:hypothetical protein